MTEHTSTALHDLVIRTFATVEAKDLETMMSLFADDAVVIDPHFPALRMQGKAAIEIAPVSWSSESLGCILTGGDTNSAPSLQASNTVVQRLLVQQRRRTSAIKHNTLPTEQRRFTHNVDESEHQRTRHVESPLRHSSFFYVHQCPFQAQKASLMSTEIHQIPLLLTNWGT